MQFASKAHKEIYEKVTEWMKELFGMFSDPISDKPAFIFRQGDTLVNVLVMPWGSDDATLTVRSYVVFDVEATQDLMHFLLVSNNEFRFGGFGLDGDDDVFFEHTIVGSTCDPEELKASVLAVANTSDRFAEKIIAAHGGVKPADRMRERAGASG